MKCNWLLQNTSVRAFTLSELLRENQEKRWYGGGSGVKLNKLIKLKINECLSKTWYVDHLVCV